MTDVDLVNPFSGLNQKKKADGLVPLGDDLKKLFERVANKKRSDHEGVSTWDGGGRSVYSVRRFDKSEIQH